MSKQPLPLAVEHWKDRAEAAERRADALARLAGERGERIRVLRALLALACEDEGGVEEEQTDTGGW